MFGVLSASRSVLLGCAAAERLAELLWSRRNLRANAGRTSRSPAGEAPPRAAGSQLDWRMMIAVHTAWIVLPTCEAIFLGAQASDAWFAVAATAYFGSQCLRYWSIATLGRTWNARAVVDPARGFVDRGPYRWIRHPNYLAVLIDFSALPLALGAWRSWILLNAWHTPVLIRRIRSEEALLAKIPGYRAAMRAKGRFVPRMAGKKRRASGSAE